MEKIVRWDYRLLSLFVAGVLGLAAEFLAPELKITFCSIGQSTAIPALLEKSTNQPTQIPNSEK
jgi:hypothetical protein